MSALEQQCAASALVYQCLSFTGVPKPDAVFYVWSNECQVEGNNLFHPATSCAPVITANNAVGSLWCLCMLLAHVECAAYQDWTPTAFSPDLLLSLYSCKDFCDWCRILHLSLLNFVRFLLSHCFSLSSSL